MRVLHVLDHSLPLHSGYTFRTAALLREQQARGWTTFHLTSPKQGKVQAAIEESAGLRFYRTGPFGEQATSPTGYLALMRALERRIEEVAAEVRPDVIHSHSPVLNAIPALRVGRRLGIPVVHEVRGFWEDAVVDHGTTTEGSLRYRLSRAMETWAMRRADHVFAICEGLRQDIVARGIPAAKVSLIPNAVDVDTFAPGGPPDPQLQRQLGLEGANVVGFIGSFYAYEGLDLLVAALPEMLAADPSIRLLLVGGGPQEQALKAQVQALGLQDKVVFTGRVPHAQVSRYYDLIDVLAYPRKPMRLTELVTPLKPLEAMAQEQIFVASDVGGHRELIEDGRTGTLFPAGDARQLAAAVLRTLSDRAAWPQRRAQARRFVENVRTWRNSVAGYVEPYSRLTGKAA